MVSDVAKLPSLLPTHMSRGSSSGDITLLPTPRSSGAYEAYDEDATQLPNNGEFYSEVETFLNRPSPSLARIAKSSKSTENLLPMLKAERSKLRVEKPDVRASYQQNDRPSKGTKKPLDLNLVQQAFAYAEELRGQQFQDNDTHDDVQEAIQHQLAKHAISSRPPPQPEKSKGAAKPKKPAAKQIKSKTSAIYGVAERPASKPKSGPDWDSCSKDTPSNGPQHTSMDPQLVQQLLSNFQNGTTLNELRQELAASQASLKESRQILQGAAKTFFMRGGG